MKHEEERHERGRPRLVSAVHNVAVVLNVRLHGGSRVDEIRSSHGGIFVLFFGDLSGLLFLDLGQLEMLISIQGFADKKGQDEDSAFNIGRLTIVVFEERRIKVRSVQVVTADGAEHDPVDEDLPSDR